MLYFRNPDDSIIPIMMLDTSPWPTVRLSVCPSVRLSVCLLLGWPFANDHLDFFLSTRFFLISCDKHHLCLQNISSSNLRIRIQSRKHFLFLFLSKYLDVRLSSVYLRWAQLYVSVVYFLIFLTSVSFTVRLSFHSDEGSPRTTTTSSPIPDVGADLQEVRKDI